MRIVRIVFLGWVLLGAFAQCTTEKNSHKEEQVSLVKQPTDLRLHISGMTCEIGCARTIQSKLSKKAGILSAKVVFADSIATISYDANTLSPQKIITFVNGIAGGSMYTASTISTSEE